MASEESYDHNRVYDSSLNDGINGYDVVATNQKNMGKEEQAKLRREKDKIRARERRKREDEEAKKMRREKCRVAQQQRRQGETVDQREHRLAVDRERAKRRRMKESEEEKQHRLEMNRIRTAIRRRGTVDNAMDALKIFHDDPEVKDLLSIPGNRVVQLECADDPTRISIGVVNEADESVFFKLVPFRKETEEQKQARLEKGRLYAAKRRREETPETRKKRLERERVSVRLRRQKRKSRNNSGDYPPELVSENQDVFVDSIGSQEEVGDIYDQQSLSSPSLKIDESPVRSVIPEEEQDEEDDQVDEPISVGLTENDVPPASTSADALASINGYLLGTNPLSVSFTTNEPSSLLDFTQIYSHVLHPSTSDSWPNSDNILKDKSDMYLMHNLGIDTSLSPSTNIFNNLPQPQPLHPTSSTFFQNSVPADEPSNPMTIGMLLRNLSSNQPNIDAAFNPSPFAPSLLGAGLNLCASPSVNIFNPLDTRVDSLLGPGSACFPSTSISGLPSVSEPEDNNLDVDTLNIGLSVASTTMERLYEAVQLQNIDEEIPLGVKGTLPPPPRQKFMQHFDKIVQNSFESLMLVLEASAIELLQEGAHVDGSDFRGCQDLSMIVNPGLHLIVSAYLIENTYPSLRSYYYTSIDRLLKTRNHIDSLKIFGNDNDDRNALSEMYDTLRQVHVEVMKALIDKRKSDHIDATLYNFIERADFVLKRIQLDRISSDKSLTFLDLALTEILDFLDHIAQINWIAFPALQQHRIETHENPAFLLYRQA